MAAGKFANRRLPRKWGPGGGGSGRGVGMVGRAVDHAPPTVNRRFLKALITESGLQPANTCMDKSRVDRPSSRIQGCIE